MITLDPIPSPATRCSSCDKAAVARCKSCGKGLCADHDVYDDPYHASGLFYRPGHWCKGCLGKRQGKAAATVVLIATVVLGLLVVIAIIS